MQAPLAISELSGDLALEVWLKYLNALQYREKAVRVLCQWL